MKFRSLKYKILLWFITITSIVLFVFSFALYYLLEDSIELRIKDDLYHNAISIYEKLSKNNLTKIIDSSYIDGAEAVVIRDGKIINKTETFTLDNYRSYTYKNRIFFAYETNDEYKLDAIYILKFNKPFDGMILIYKKDLFNKAEDIEDILVFLNPLLFIIMIFIANRLIDKILIPIRNITKSTKEISVSNFSHKMKLPTNHDEITELIDSFNMMIERLKDGVDRLDRFNSDISHELRTPLTIIKGELEVTLKKKRESKQYISSIKTVLNETVEMQKLVDSLLLITKYSKQNIEATFVPCHLDSMLMNVMDKYDMELTEKNIKLHIDKLESIVINANNSLINSIFSNIIDNAVKYSLKNKNIEISLFKKDKNIYFTVKDEGIGIDQEELHKITDRFYRVDESRSKSIKGFGLGLSIVKNSLELHNGTLNISSKKGGGTFVEVVL